MATGIDDQWSANLMDMTKFAKYNNGFMYVLNETKAAIAERVIKTIKTRIYRFMT